MALGSVCVFPIDLFRTATFRLTLGLIAVILFSLFLQLALLYGQINAYERLHSSILLRHSADMLMHENRHDLEVKLRERNTSELRISLNGAALFDMDHRLITGDIPVWPHRLKENDDIQLLSTVLSDGKISVARFLVVKIKGQDAYSDCFLVLERSLLMADELRYIVRSSALISLAPLALFALFAGVFLGHRTLSRIRGMRQAIERIMNGDLHERLPVGRSSDSVERLARAVNHMLGRLEQLVGEISEVGNNIAHDLRTPLARVQMRLERASSMTSSLPAEDAACFGEIIAQSQRDLEQCFSVITALLRIAEIETGHRRAGFSYMPLLPLLEDIVDLYEPIAEAKGLILTIERTAIEKSWANPMMSGSQLLAEPGTGHPVEEGMVLGDRELLNEVLANLLDNAIKFTPQGGKITVRVGGDVHGDIWFEVRDTGMGIVPEERDAVLGRFYRADKSRHVPGHGLGLSLVAVIVALHEARLEIEDNDEAYTGPMSGSSSGTVFRVIFPPLDTFSALLAMEKVKKKNRSFFPLPLWKRQRKSTL